MVWELDRESREVDKVERELGTKEASALGARIQGGGGGGPGAQCGLAPLQSEKVGEEQAEALVLYLVGPLQPSWPSSCLKPAALQLLVQ